MASIAHVISRNTVEFHRLHSHREIVFWRFNTKNFSYFAHNDLLFFLCKTRRHEKGLLGFGQLKQIKNLKTKTLYNRYQEKLGYASKDEFLNSISRLRDEQELPDKLNCLFLDNVTYFKSPIYLSDYGYDLNKQVESFVYFDSESNITSQILRDVKKFSGLDLWSESQDDVIHHLESLATLYEVSQLISDSALFNPKDNRFKIEFGEPLMSNPTIKYTIINNTPTIHIPIYTQNKKEHYSVLGLIGIINETIRTPLKIEVLGRSSLTESVLAQYESAL